MMPLHLQATLNCNHEGKLVRALICRKVAPPRARLSSPWHIHLARTQNTEEVKATEG